MIAYIKVSKNPETSRSFENNILSRAVQSNFEVNIAQVFITVVAESSRVSCSIAEETRETYERLSQRPQTLKNALNFLVELKPCFTKVFKDHKAISEQEIRRTCMLQLIFIKPSDVTK